MSEQTICPACNGSFPTEAMDYTDRGLMCSACALDATPMAVPGTTPLMLVGYTVLGTIYTCSPPCFSSRRSSSTTVTIGGVTEKSTQLSVDPPGLIFAIIAALITGNGIRLAAGASAAKAMRVVVGLWFAVLSIVALVRIIAALPISLPF